MSTQPRNGGEHQFRETFLCVFLCIAFSGLDVTHFAVFIAENTHHLDLPPQYTLVFTSAFPEPPDEGLIMHTVLTIHSQVRKVGRLLNQTREFSSMPLNLFLSALVQPKGTNTLKPRLFHP